MAFSDFLPNLLVGLVRGTSRPYYGAGDQRLSINEGGEAVVAQGLPPKSELVRLGNTWTCTIAAANAFTYVAGLPTTRAELVLYNGEPSTGKAYVIDSAFMFGITTMGAAQPITLVVQNVPSAATVPTDNTAQLITSRSGRANYGGAAKRALANTAAGQIADKWEVIASATPSPTTNLGASVYADLFGGFVVRPGGVFALAGVAGTAAGTAVIGVTWHEVQLNLG